VPSAVGTSCLIAVSRLAVDVTVPLFAKPLKPGEVGVIMPLDLVEVTGSEGMWHGQCESLRIEVAVEQQTVVNELRAINQRGLTCV